MHSAGRRARGCGLRRGALGHAVCCNGDFNLGRLEPALSFLHQNFSSAYFDAAVAPWGIAVNPSPGTSVLPSIPSGDHASTMALAIFAIVTSPSLSTVQ